MRAAIAASLGARAHAHDLELCQFVEQLIRESVPQQVRPALSPADLASAWREASRGLPHTPPLSDEAISRESI
jgi:hypothetical protein